MNPTLLVESDAAALTRAREAVSSGSKSGDEIRRILDVDAAKFRHAPIETVTAKTQLAVSGNRNDYLSIGPYWWPNPEKPGGLPYTRRDGHVNPESYNESSCDRPRFGRLTAAVGGLARSAWVLKNQADGEDAGRLLRAWFVEPDTAMTAHLRFAQAIPGVVDGRGIGIIDVTGMVGLLDAVLLLRQCPGAIDGKSMETINAWFRDFSVWLRTSKHGLDERRERNNHGTWYDAIDCALALFLDERAYAREALEGRTAARIEAQIQESGEQPHELARTRSLDYSVMNLRGFWLLARMAGHAGVDWWTGGHPAGQRLDAATRFVVRHATGGARWPYPQLNEYDPAGALARLLWTAAAVRREPAWARVADGLGDAIDRAERITQLGDVSSFRGAGVQG